MIEGLPPGKLSEHLNTKLEGAKPIIVCIGTPEDFTNEAGHLGDDSYIRHGKHPQNVYFYASIDYLNNEKFLNGGEKTYVMSTINDSDKFSEDFADCLGLVVAGIDRETGKNVSFLSHQNPTRFLNDKKRKFFIDLEKRLNEFKDKCIPGTKDAVMIGGNTDHPDRDNNHEVYLGSSYLIGAEFKKILGFLPVISNGPKGPIGRDDIFYDNDNRRLYFIRPYLNEDIGDFPAGEWENSE